LVLITDGLLITTSNASIIYLLTCLFRITPNKPIT